MDTTTWIMLAVLASVVIFSVMFRKHILLLIRKWWTVYQEQKKYDQLYARLDRNKAGKFSMKQHRKDVLAQQKATMKKNQDAAAEKKSVKGK